MWKRCVHRHNKLKVLRLVDDSLLPASQSKSGVFVVLVGKSKRRILMPSP